LLYWKQFLAIFGKGPERPRCNLEWKRPASSRKYVVGILTAIGMFAALPYGEELWRCYKADKNRKQAQLSA
jgi:hypothetical protein